MKMIFTFLFMLFLSGSVSSQTSFLEDYNFEDGGYYLLGTRSVSDRNRLADSLKEWYTDDISVMNEFKKEWVFTVPGKRYAF